MNPRWRKRQKIHALHKRDIEVVLGDLGLLDLLETGQARCCICDRPLAVDDVQCLFEKDGKLMLCCNTISCFEQILPGGEHARYD